MIIKTDDFIDELCREFPDLSRKSIESICLKGMKGINRVMRENLEIFIKASKSDHVKFFVPYSPEKHEQFDTRNYYRKLKRNKNNGR